MPHQYPIKIAILAMGGQGGGVLSDWIVKLAENANYLTQATSVPGVAQRTGATVYYIEIIPGEIVEQRGQKPVMALMPVKGDVDIVIAGELVEAGRALMRGFISKQQTTVITSSHRDYAVTEKIGLGDGRIDQDRIRQKISERAKQIICFDMAALAEESGSIISAVLFGALAASKTLEFSRDDYETVIRNEGVALDTNLKGFDSGYVSSVHSGTKPDHSAERRSAKVISAEHPQIQALVERIYKDFPAEAHETLIEGIRKLIDYQDIAYAKEYLEKATGILELDERGKDYRLTREIGRYLALWMSYEDTIRVADLKIRRQRFQRIRNEVHAGPGQHLDISEYMHPRVEEICGTMPVFLAACVLNSPLLRGFVGLFCKKGRRIKTTSISGYLMLFCIAGLRRWRRSSYRYKIETENMEDWVARVKELSSTDYELAVAVAECQRLIKGYGDTHERGIRNFKRIIASLETIKTNASPAKIVDEMRDAALADEDGGKLDELMSKLA